MRPDLPARGTRLYAANVRWLQQEHAFRRALERVGRDRREKALSYRFAKDRALSLGAGLLLNLAVGREAPWIPVPPEVRLGACGKPFLAADGAPRISLSHSGEYAVCAIGSEEVGADIEQVVAADADVARRCFEGRELLRALPDGSRPDAEEFFRIWTMKESFIKLIGTGLSLDPSRFEILDEEPARVRQDFDRETYCCRVYEELPGYKLAVCTRGGAFPARIERIGQAELSAAWGAH